MSLKRSSWNPWSPCEKVCSADHYWWSGLRWRRDVSQLEPVSVGRVACVGDGTSLSWNPCWLVDPSRLKDTSFPTPEVVRRCYESDAQFTAALEKGWPGRTWNCRMSWHRADSKRRTSLQHSERKSEVLHCVGRRRRESVWGRVCWGSQATSQGRKTRGETGAQCSRGTLAQRDHVCRS